MIIFLGFFKFLFLILETKEAQVAELPLNGFLNKMKVQPAPNEAEEADEADEADPEADA